MILVGLSANLPSRFGEPADSFSAALKALQDRNIQILAQSRIWLSAPVPVSDQPWYHNAVIQVGTNKDPLALLRVLQDIEQDFGRVRRERNEARVIDLDLLTYNDQTMNEEALILPHPRMDERAFVLLPIMDIAPRWVHPVSRVSLKELLARVPKEQKAEPMERPYCA